MSLNTPRIFGQTKPAAGVSTVLYTVVSNTRAQVTLFVCNQDANVEFFRIALVPVGSSLIDARYIAWDSPLTGNGVFSVSGIGLNAGDSIHVQSTNGDLSFTATGIQLS